MKVTLHIESLGEVKNVLAAIDKYRFASTLAAVVVIVLFAGCGGLLLWLKH